VTRRGGRPLFKSPPECQALEFLFYLVTSPRVRLIMQSRTVSSGVFFLMLFTRAPPPSSCFRAPGQGIPPALPLRTVERRLERRRIVLPSWSCFGDHPGRSLDRIMAGVSGFLSCFFRGAPIACVASTWGGVWSPFCAIGLQVSRLRPATHGNSFLSASVRVARATIRPLGSAAFSSCPEVATPLESLHNLPPLRVTFFLSRLRHDSHGGCSLARQALTPFERFPKPRSFWHSWSHEGFKENVFRPAN